jgi:hypothetical protein
MKLAVRAIVALVVLAAIWFAATSLYQMVESKRIATEMIQSYCHDQNYDVAKVTGPVDGKVGGCMASYSWKYDNSPQHLELLISFYYLSKPKLATWDENRND